MPPRPIPFVPGLPILGSTLSLTQDAIGFMTSAYHEYGARAAAAVD